jgi:hypothetical protein
LASSIFVKFVSCTDVSVTVTFWSRRSGFVPSWSSRLSPTPGLSRRQRVRVRQIHAQQRRHLSRNLGAFGRGIRRQRLDNRRQPVRNGRAGDRERPGRVVGHALQHGRRRVRPERRVHDTSEVEQVAAVIDLFAVGLLRDMYIGMPAINRIGLATNPSSAARR